MYFAQNPVAIAVARTVYSSGFAIFFALPRFLLVLFVLCARIVSLLLATQSDGNAVESVVETVTKRNAPLTIHVPSLQVMSWSGAVDRPDVLKVVARWTQSSEPWILEKVHEYAALPNQGQKPERINDYANFLQYGGSISQVLPDQAVTDFVGNKERRPLDVHAFVQKYGLFRWEIPDISDVPVAEQRLFWVSISDFNSERERLLCLLRIFGCLRDERVDKARELAKQLELPCADDPAKALSIAIGARLGQVHFALDSTLQSVILKCADVLTGLYAWLLNAIIRQAGWSACPHCGRVFVAAGKRKFCDSRCERAEKQKRYRERKTLAITKRRKRGRR